MSVVHFKVNDREGIEIAGNLTEICKSCYSEISSKGTTTNCPLYSTKRRIGKIENNKSITFLCSSRTKTTKLFKGELEALSYALPNLKLPVDTLTTEIKTNEQKRVNRLVHNLTSINGKNIQEIYNLVPQHVLSSNTNSQIENIMQIMAKNPKEAAFMFLRIAKHNIHMKSEFSIYKKLDREKPSLEKKDHPIHRVLMNVLHSFFADFSDKDVYVDVGECDSTVMCDYESIQVALYHLLENAAKYVQPHTKISISFRDSLESLNINFNMNSLYIEPEEKAKIFEEGYSGKESKRAIKDGDGIGMWRIKQMLELNNGKIEVIPGLEIEKKNGFRFAENKFIISLRK